MHDGMHHSVKDGLDLHRDTDALSLEELESEISTLSSHIYAATCRLLVPIREFDERGAWGRAGAKSMAHWLNWRVGLGLGAAREKVRVAHALADLPQLSEAFSKGEISYSKVRALTRMVTAESDAQMLEMSRYGTASQMERLVRGIRQAKRAEDRDFAYGHEDEPRRRLASQRADALSLMTESFLAHEAKAGDRYQAVVHVSAETCTWRMDPRLRKIRPGAFSATVRW